MRRQTSSLRRCTTGWRHADRPRGRLLGGGQQNVCGFNTAVIRQWLRQLPSRTSVSPSPSPSTQRIQAELHCLPSCPEKQFVAFPLSHLPRERIAQDKDDTERVYPRYMLEQIITSHRTSTPSANRSPTSTVCFDVFHVCGAITSRHIVNIAIRVSHKLRTRLSSMARS